MGPSQLSKTVIPQAMAIANATSDTQIDEQLPSDNQSVPVLMSADSEEQVRAAIAASMLTAQTEEEKREKEAGNDEQTSTVDLDTEKPDTLHRQKSESLDGFWAKGQAISTAYLTSLFTEKQYECVVCYEDYEVGQTLAKLRCGHQMHKKCAMEWLKVSPTCPFCRVNILRD